MTRSEKVSYCLRKKGVPERCGMHRRHVGWMYDRSALCNGEKITIQSGSGSTSGITAENFVFEEVRREAP